MGVKVRWYLNDASLQGQFADAEKFSRLLGALISARRRSDRLRGGFRTTRSFSERLVDPTMTVRTMLQRSRDRDLRRAVLEWLDRTGPFVEDDRRQEIDDYFECDGIDVTDGGLGEAARRVKAREAAEIFSFEGGTIDFARTPVTVHHGLAESRLAAMLIDNHWKVEDLERSAMAQGPAVATWRALIERARALFPRLVIPDTVHLATALAREPFDAVLRDRILVLLGHLDAYMDGRDPTGVEGPDARKIVRDYFVGERALFSGESPTNQRNFSSELTFPHPTIAGRTIFAHWHGKISHRYFRIHFEWPVAPSTSRLSIVYIGPKLSKG